MEQAQGEVENGEEIAPGGDGLLAILAGEQGLDPLDVPVAELVPEEVVDEVGRLVEAEIGQGLVDLAGDAREAREHPTLDQQQAAVSAMGGGRADLGAGEVFEGEAGGLDFFEIQEEEAGGVPD